jgi:hypothetical protein
VNKGRYVWRIAMALVCAVRVHTCASRNSPLILLILHLPHYPPSNPTPHRPFTLEHLIPAFSHPESLPFHTLPDLAMPQLFPVPSPHVPATSPRANRHSDSDTTTTRPTPRFHAVSTPISQPHSDSDALRADDTSQAHHVHFASPPSHPPRHWTRPSPSPYVNRPPPPILPGKLDLEKQTHPTSSESGPHSVPSARSEESAQEEFEETDRAKQRRYYVVPGFGWRIRRVYVWVIAGLAVIALPAAIGLSQI